MKKYYSLLIFIALIGCTSNQDKQKMSESQRLIELKNKELELKERELALKEAELESIREKALSEPRELRDVYKEVKPSVYLVYTASETNLSQGSAFVISGDGITISNYHLFYDASEAILINEQGDKFLITEILDYSEVNDYIIFKIENNSKTLSSVSIAENISEIGEQCFAVGNPLGLTQTLSSGIISSYRDENRTIQITTEITHGSSGGPLFNKNGEVIGITSSGLGEANINYAVNIQSIPYRRYLNMSSLPPSQESTQNEELNDKVIKRILNDYYTSFANNDFDRLTNIYADNLTRFFTLFNITKAEAIRRNKNYDKMFNVKSKQLYVRWNTLKIDRKENGEVVANFIIDWQIDRMDKHKASKFVVYHTVGLNSKGKIRSIYENVLRKE